MADVALATHQAAFERDKGGLVDDRRRGRRDQVGQGDTWAGHFFSSVYKKALPGPCFLNLSLVQVETRASYPLITEQLVREEVQESAPKAVKEKHGKRGRPKGSVNKNRKDVGLSPFQAQLQVCIRTALGAGRFHERQGNASRKFRQFLPVHGDLFAESSWQPQPPVQRHMGFFHALLFRCGEQL